jgi:protein-disulfide isomerase
VRVTRRQLLLASSTFALATAIAGSGFELLFNSHQALAQSATEADLMQAGPLGEESMGNDKAPVTIIEYASMTCPHCAHFALNTFPEIKEKYIDTGKVRFILREFPFDPVAEGAFMLARCAGKDKYMPMVETLFAKQADWVVQKPLDPLKEIAKQAGFTGESFEQCLANQKILDSIQAVRDRASQKLGVNSTPTFFVNGKKMNGDLPIEEFAKVIDPYLKSGEGFLAAIAAG